ncbi:MAG: methylated-DNA--[protein]-cysteine S-methyltransferase [Lysinibacillus sp.]
MYCVFMDSPIGRLKIISNDRAIIAIEHNDSGEPSESPPVVLLQCVQQLQQYFAGKRTTFDVPVEIVGTGFQQQVWQTLQKIPFGETRSYKQIAEMINNPKAMRAVGNANNKNRLPLLIPCHRVIGANGSLVGYALGLEHKKYLLELECGQ